MIDVQLLRILKHRSEFQKLSGALPKAALDAQTVAILDDFGVYFEKFPEHRVIDFQVFLPMFKRQHPGLTDEQFNSYVGIIRNMIPDADDCTKQGILADMHELALATRLANLTAKFNEGELEGSISDEVTFALDRYKIDMGAKAAAWIDTDIGELLADEINDAGIRWRLSCLNESMRGLRPGDFGIVAGRPDKGKTTFLTSEITFMAPQLPPERNVIWLNNEGKGSRIVPRLYQSALGIPMSEMVSMHNAGGLVPKYRELIGGRLDRIRVHDIHGYHTGQVELILEQGNPGIVIFDMIDHIRGFGNEARTDLALEEMYKWARERAVKYDCICLATSQISNEGDGLQFPTLGMLKDSKTGKQGACDFQLMIGASNDPNLQNSRFIGLPKNKLRREGGPSDPRAEVLYQPGRARYSDLMEGS